MNESPQEHGFPVPGATFNQAIRLPFTGCNVQSLLLLFLMFLMVPTCAAANLTPIASDRQKSLPVVDVRDFGATADGKTDASLRNDS